ncbi:MAG: hypothetical protein KKE62_01970 [Proteobacteria bacterium]|nr:hypothetical protein [Pseudomonadota bacterium]MBU1387094.1 hypothetical protein [Pseudomonadota bacterium]MBU1541589.1 hypothetical protein [Pseudomonadota bacterium]MBU2430348.1 hypothetical protein [Pseudomonadota bacterium]MBU2482546.1 hypothetical protein [Pseudomonadota bacterium]
MRQLIQLIQTQLSGVVDRDTDILLIADPDIIPAGVRFPCVGIKDGKTDISELAGGVLEKSLPVDVYYYDRLQPGDDCITDFLLLGETISAKLTENYLAGYVKAVSPVSETPIRVMYTKSGLILQKGLSYQYETEE